MGSDYSGGAALRPSWLWVVPRGGELGSGGSTSWCDIPALSCISQACVVEWVSGGDGQEAWLVTDVVPLYPLIFQCVFPKSTGIHLYNHRQLHLTQEFNTDTELQGQWSLVHSPSHVALPLLGKNNDIH